MAGSEPHVTSRGMALHDNAVGNGVVRPCADNSCAGDTLNEVNNNIYTIPQGQES